MRKFLSAAAAVAVTLSSMPVAMAMQAEMSSNSMMKSGMHRVERVSRRTVTARARAASAKVRDKCKGLTGLKRAACLNPKLKNKAMKKDAMEAMKSYWFKIDGSAMLWWKNGETWERSKTSMWQDADGNWLKIGEGKFWWSADQGATWSEVPEWTWKGTDGKWYKFDTDWTLWWSTDSGATWSIVQTASWPGGM